MWNVLTTKTIARIGFTFFAKHIASIEYADYSNKLCDFIHLALSLNFKCFLQMQWRSNSCLLSRSKQLWVTWLWCHNLLWWRKAASARVCSARSLFTSTKKKKKKRKMKKTRATHNKWQLLNARFWCNFCRFLVVQLLSHLSCSFKSPAYCKLVAISMRFVAAISQGFRTSLKLDANLQVLSENVQRYRPQVALKS